MITAELKNYRQSARKVRLVADAVRGKKVTTALTELEFTPKRAALPIKKLIQSAAANAKHNHQIDVNDLYIKTIMVNEGFTMKRWIPKWRGTAHPIRKRTSSVKVELATADEKATDTKKADKSAKEAKKAKPATKKADTSDNDSDK